MPEKEIPSSRRRGYRPLAWIILDSAQVRGPGQASVVARGVHWAAIVAAALWLACGPAGVPVVAGDSAQGPGADSARPPDLRLQADLDGDGAPDDVALYQSRDGSRGFFTVGGPGGYVSPIYPLWRVAAADLDGDAADEIVLGTWTRQRRHGGVGRPRSITVLGWDGQRLVERWRGSALAQPLLDFRVCDLDDSAEAELLALEHGRDACVLTAYAWTGFGFHGRGRRAVPCAEVHLCDPPAATARDLPDGRDLALVCGPWSEPRRVRLNAGQVLLEEAPSSIE
jgi:hypothetical protein